MALPLRSFVCYTFANTLLFFMRVPVGESKPGRPMTSLESRGRALLQQTSGKAGSKSSPTGTWPSAEAWSKHRQALAALTFRRLGIGPQRNVDNGIWTSQVFDALGACSFTEFRVVRFPGTVIWCNYDLARQLGFEVPPTNQLTPALHQQLLATLSFRSLGPTEKVSGQEVITMYADKYGGDGVAPALGAGRAGFLPYGNLYVKGVGFTPLFRHNDPNDFVHSHGGVHLEDCLSEAVFGEVNKNLFAHGSTRILAIIDQGKYVTEPSGRQRHIALAVRTGAQLRPGHLLGKRTRGSGSLLEMFIRMTTATGQLVSRKDESTGAEFPDVSSTMLGVINDHAETGADSFRWRMIHGALSPSNMDLSGAMLDLPTQSTQPRTAPIFKLDYAQSVFGTEHKERGFQLVPMYRKLLRTTDPATRERFNLKWLNISDEMDKAYSKYLQVKLLSAAGLKTEVASRIQSEHEEIASHFTNLVLEIATLKNPGSACVARRVVEHVSVLDVFNLLGSFPEDYFADTNANHKKNILKHLRPLFRGNRFHIAKRKSVVDLLATKFANTYRELMNSGAAYAEEYYDNLEGMKASIAARAAFENEPLAALYTSRLYEDLNKAIAVYKSTGNARIIRDAIDCKVAASLRSVEGLLALGNSRRLEDGGIELEMRTIDGVSYSVRAWNDATQTRRLHVSIPLEPDGKNYLSAVPRLGRLSRRQIEALRYRFTTDGWKTFVETKGVLVYHEEDGFSISFEDLRTLVLVGRLEGIFYLSGKGSRGRIDKTPPATGYVFAMPDRHELVSMVAGPIGENP